MKLILCRGCPGSGKSTFVRTVFPDIFHVENDMWHMRDGEYKFNPKKQATAVSWCMDMTRMALANGMDVVVSNTFTKRGYVEAYKKIAEDFGAEFIVYRLHGEFENRHDVPANVLENMKNAFADWPGEVNTYPNKGNSAEPYLYVY